MNNFTVLTVYELKKLFQKKILWVTLLVCFLGIAFTLLCFTESVRLDEILKYMDSQPTYLQFDEMGVLRKKEDNQAFFENI